MQIWRDLQPEEVKEFVQWALDNWKPDTQINNVWHPVVRSTWGKLDEAFATAKRQTWLIAKTCRRRLNEAIE